MAGIDEHAAGASPEAGTIASPVAAPSADQIAAYLRTHPDFLQHYPDLLENLEFSHSSGSAVSLIERQVELLRARNRRLEDRYERLLNTARDNEMRAVNTQRLARALLRAPSLAAVAAGRRVCKREDFGIELVYVGIFSSLLRRYDIEGVASIEPEGPVARACDNLLRTRLIECGPVEPARAELLFPRAGLPVPASAAIVPLEKDKNLGIIAFGARDPQRFQPRQGKLFLEMIADLVAAAVRARLT
jgi:uncharacterized protein YigA (DUF484 family)